MVAHAFPVADEHSSFFESLVEILEVMPRPAWFAEIGLSKARSGSKGASEVIPNHPGQRGTIVAHFDAQKPYSATQLFPALTEMATTKARLESAIELP